MYTSLSGLKFIEMTKKTIIEAQTLKIPKVILITAKLLEVISLKLITLFVAKLFITPIKHKIPKREDHMARVSKQHLLHYSLSGISILNTKKQNLKIKKL